MHTIERCLFAAALAGMVIAAGAGPINAAGTTEPAKKVIAQATGDLNGDRVADRVQLLQAPDDQDIDVAIFLSAGGKLPDKPTVYMPGFGWGEADDVPAPKITARGSLLLEFANDQGRDRWHKQITIAFRDNALVVAGYSYESRDALDPDKGQACDINLLTGTGTRNLKPVKFPSGGVPVARWNDDTVPSPCKFDD